MYFGNCLAFFQWEKSADWFSLCNVSHPPRGMKIAFCTHSCVALYYQSNLWEEALRWSFAGVDLFSAWRVAAVLRMSMTGSGAPVLCTQNPQPLQQLFQPQAKRRSQDRRNKEGLLQPLERENKRDRYLNCVCRCAEAPTSIKSLNVRHLKCLNFLQYVKLSIIN